MLDSDDLIALLDLAEHPEGGWFRETWRAPAPAHERAAGSAIYFLLTEGQTSYWHRVDATEIWHFYAGDPLELAISPDGQAVDVHVLGTDLANDQRPQLIVPAGAWQSARSLGRWTLVGCTVSPAFEFAGFELAHRGWRPGLGGRNGA